MDGVNHTVFFDESGNTEEGTKDVNQYFFVYASHSFPESVCKTVLKSKFPKSQANEIKYVNLSVEKRISRTIETLEELKGKSKSSCYRVYAIYKPMYIFNSMMTLFHDSYLEDSTVNVNIYDPDFMYLRLRSTWNDFFDNQGPKILQATIRLFEKFTNSTKKEDYNKLCEQFRCDNDIGLFREMYLWATTNSAYKTIIMQISRRSNNEQSFLDITLPTIIQLLYHWSLYFKGNSFKVIHDKSRALLKRKSMLDSILVSNPKDFITPGILESKISEKQFYVNPHLLPIQDFQFFDSKNHYALQIADILAGVTNDLLKQIQAENQREKKCFDRYFRLFEREDYIELLPCDGRFL